METPHALIKLLLAFLKCPRLGGDDSTSAVNANNTFDPKAL